jgi:hypothetical protein
MKKNIMTHHITTINNLHVAVIVVVVMRIIREVKLVLDELLGCVDPVLVPLPQAEAFDLETRMKDWFKWCQQTEIKTSNVNPPIAI